MKPRINIITLAVDDLEKSLRFYREGLGLPSPGILEGMDHAAFELQDGLSLVLYPRHELAKVAKESTGERRSSLEVILSHPAGSREEVDSILGRAKAAGATLPGPAQEQPWGYFGYFKDLDGHLWEVIWNPDF